MISLNLDDRFIEVVLILSGTAALHALFYVLAVNSVGKAITQYLGVDRAF